MENIDECLFIEFNPNVLEDVRKQFGFQEREDMNRAIDVLERWLKQQNHFLKKDFDRKFLERSLIRAKGSLEKTKKRLDKYCTVRTIRPNYFKDYDFDNEFKDLQGIVTHIILPKPTKDHYRIYMYKSVGHKFPDTFTFDIARNSMMMCEYIINHDYSAGCIFVYDIRQTDLLALIQKVDIVLLQEGASIMFEAYGIKLKSIHLLTESKLVNLILAIAKQILKGKLFERIHVHRNLDELHKFVPKDVLPEEYGGSETRSLEELQDEFTKVARSEHEVKLRKEMNEAKTDEFLRPKHKFVENYMGTPGSFRTFVID